MGFGVSGSFPAHDDHLVGSRPRCPSRSVRNKARISSPIPTRTVPAMIIANGNPSPVAPVKSHRDAFIQWCLWGVKHADHIGHHDQIGYAFIGTYPLIRPGTLPFNTSCAGFVTLMAHWAGAWHDPNGKHFNGMAYTGYMLGACEAIPRSEAAAGDLAVLGPGNGEHVLALVSDQHKGDFQTVSHGKPGDPWSPLLSVEERAHDAPTRFLRFLALDPAPAKP